MVLWEGWEGMTHHIARERVIKVEEIGDYWRNQTRPQIRLKGKWMAKAGICPNNYVLVTNPQPGILVLSLVAPK